MATNGNQKCVLTSKRTQDDELIAQSQTRRLKVEAFTAKSSKKKANKKLVAIEDKENLFGLTFCNTIRGNKAQKICKKLETSTKDEQTNVVQNFATYPYNKSDKDKLVKDSNIKISANERENEFNNVVLNAPNKSDGNKLVKDSTIQISVNKEETRSKVLRS